MKKSGLWLLIVICLAGGACRKSDELTAGIAGGERSAGKLDWTAFGGQSLFISLNKHPYTEALIRQIPKFEELTGIRVRVNILAEEEYFEKLVIDLSTESDNLDVFMTGPQLNWGYAAAGWVEPLEGYFSSLESVPPGYDLEDFYPSLLASNTWNLLPGKQNLGRGSLWAIPVQVETYCLAYRKDWADQAGLAPPQTYQDLHEFAGAIHRRRGSSDRRYGIIARGLGTWPTINTGFLTGYSSWGCVDFNENMECRINAPEAVAFTEIWVKANKEYGPPDWANITWYDAKQKFASGEFGIFLDCDFFAGSYENPANSEIAGRVGYAPPPAGPGGQIRSNLWTWSLSINSHSRRKMAAWLFLLWATGREQLLATALEGNLNPTRKSVWESPEVVRLTEGWAGYRSVVEKNLSRHALIQWTPQKELIATGDRWARALQEIWGGKSAQKALDAASADIDRIIKNAYGK